jgi:pimeloyl-ACP methyl ester carboxylesterase
LSRTLDTSGVLCASPYSSSFRTDIFQQDYLEALPKGNPKGTIVLIHGFPDISLGWRYQILYLMNLGYRTIALDCMGYGKTVSPSIVPEQPPPHFP